MAPHRGRSIRMSVAWRMAVYSAHLASVTCQCGIELMEWVDAHFEHLENGNGLENRNANHAEKSRGGGGCAGGVCRPAGFAAPVGRRGGPLPSAVGGHGFIAGGPGDRWGNDSFGSGGRRRARRSR